MKNQNPELLRSVEKLRKVVEAQPNATPELKEASRAVAQQLEAIKSQEESDEAAADPSGQHGQPKQPRPDSRSGAVVSGPNSK